ncbi:hypothetical protein ACFWD1_17110 [Micromonospora chalcea]
MRCPSRSGLCARPRRPRRQRLEPARGAQTQLDRLSDDVRAWLLAKRFGIVFELAEEAQSRGWIIRTPAANGRRSHVAVLAVDGELQARHVQRALRILSDGRADTAWTVAANKIVARAHQAAGGMNRYLFWEQRAFDLQQAGDAGEPDALRSEAGRCTDERYRRRPFAAPRHWAAFAVHGAG